MLVGDDMRRNLLILLLILASIFLSGCHFKSETILKYELPEGEEIQKALDTLANSVISMDIDSYMACFSLDCSFLHKINEEILSSKAQNIKFKSIFNKN